MMEAQDPSERFWRLDKKVPLALILTIIGQTGVFIWWASSLNERVNVLEKASAMSSISAPIQAERLTRVESRLEAVQRDATEIKADIKSLIRREPAATK